MPTVSAKVSDDEKLNFTKIAKENNLSVSAMIKQAFNNATIKDTTDEKKIHYELKRIGNNLNQVAYHCNSNNVIDKQVLLSLSRIEEELKKLLQ